jgi:OOP family OmpA-OmpF porin
MNVTRPTALGIAAALLAGALITSGPIDAAEHGYLKDAEGEPVVAGGGGCVHTGRWKESMPTCPEPTLVVEEGQAMIVFAAQDSEFFGFDRIKLSDQVKADLDAVVAAVQDADMIHGVIITGHADRIGPAPYNEKLALRRAEAVKAYLVSKGIPAERIQAQSDGVSDPLVTCTGIRSKRKLIRCLAPNRRVDIEALLADSVDIGTLVIPRSAD